MTPAQCWWRYLRGGSAHDEAVPLSDDDRAELLPDWERDGTRNAR